MLGIYRVYKVEVSVDWWFREPDDHESPSHSPSQYYPKERHRSLDPVPWNQPDPVNHSILVLEESLENLS